MIERTIRGLALGAAFLICSGARAATWTAAPVDLSTVVAAATNLGHSTYCELEVTGHSITDSGVRSMAVKSVLSDGVFPTSDFSWQNAYGVGDNAILTYGFYADVDFKGIRFFSNWKDAGRNGFGFKSVEILKDGIWQTLENSGLAKYDPAAAGAQLGTFGDGVTTIVSGIRGLRINCDSMDNNGTGVIEIEILGDIDTTTYSTSDFWAESPLPSELSITDTPNILGEPGVVLTADRGSYNEEFCGAFSNAVVLTNGAFAVCTSCSKENTWAAGDYASLEFTLPSPRDIGRLLVYTLWSDAGRTGIDITNILCKTSDDATYRRLDGFFPCSYGQSDVSGTDPGRRRILIARTDNGNLAEGVTALKFLFGKAKNHGTGIVEVQALYRTTATWSEEDWTGAIDRTARTDNLLRLPGSRLAIGDNEAIEGTDGASHRGAAALAALTNGVVDSAYPKTSGHLHAIGNNAYVQYDFAGSANIAELGFWTGWDGGRDGQRVAGISALFRGESEYRTLNNLPFMCGGTDDNTTSGFLHFTLKPKQGKYLMKKVRSIRVRFGKQDNDWSGYHELEALGTPNSGFIFSVW